MGVLLNEDLSRIPTKGKNDSFFVLRPSLRLFKELHLYSEEDWGRDEGQKVPSRRECG